MKRSILLIPILLILMLIMAACGGGDHPIVSRWSFRDDIPLELEFFADGNGIEVYDGRTYPFNWEISDNILHINFTGITEESFIYELLNVEMHGHPIEHFAFLITDNHNFLILSDSHGHGHFSLNFVNVSD